MKSSFVLVFNINPFEYDIGPSGGQHKTYQLSKMPGCSGRIDSHVSYDWYTPSLQSSFSFLNLSPRFFRNGNIRKECVHNFYASTSISAPADFYGDVEMIYFVHELVVAERIRSQRKCTHVFRSIQFEEECPIFEN